MLTLTDGESVDSVETIDDRLLLDPIDRKLVFGDRLLDCNAWRTSPVMEMRQTEEWVVEDGDDDEARLIPDTDDRPLWVEEPRLGVGDMGGLEMTNGTSSTETGD